MNSVPVFPWPPPILAELREIFRPRPKLVSKPRKPEPPAPPKDAV
jgi:hypothetical protein